MKKQKQKRNYEEVSYWESMADSMVGLLLCILLITLLLIMYLVRVTDEDYVDLEQGNSFEAYIDPDEGGGNHSYGKVDDDAGTEWDTDAEGMEEGEDENDDGGGFDGGGEDNEDDQPEDLNPGVEQGEGTDRAAVLVQVVDGETGRTIKKDGMQFELYGLNSALQVLSTYYPKKIDYKTFVTEKSGTFYFPEKLSLTGYTLHALSNIPGYDLASNTEFVLEKPYDWNDPYVVSVTVLPSKNTIRIKLKDVDNGEAVTGASFHVVAAEDIVTQDGTTRYKQGEIADYFSVSDDGMGESGELYLGEYLLRQDTVPQYYGKITADKPVSVEAKTEASETVIHELSEDKTNVTVTLTDALKNTIYLEGARFAVKEDDGTVVSKEATDKNGRFSVTNLKKNTTYHIQQLSSVSDYQVDRAEHSFTVNGDGLIDGNTEMELTVKNRIIRISIGVKDRIFRGQVSDINVALLDAEGNVVKNWSTTGLEQTLEGLKEGEYQVILDGNEAGKHQITVRDVTEIQEFQFEKWTMADVGVILALGLFCLGMIVLLVKSAKYRKKRKNEEGE